MESTLITFINNSSNIFRITILYLFQISIHIKLIQFKIFNNKIVYVYRKLAQWFQYDTQYLSTTLRNQLSRGLG